MYIYFCYWMTKILLVKMHNFFNVIILPVKLCFAKKSFIFLIIANLALKL